MYGYIALEAIGKNRTEMIIPPEMWDEARHAMCHLAVSGQPTPTSEHSHLKNDGTHVSVLSIHAVVKQSESEIELFCIDIDLFRRKKAEHESLESRTRLERALTGAEEGVIDCDMVQGTLIINDSMATIRGYTPDEFPKNGKTFL
ncbi:MAG: PAS domain-containing protein [Methanomicrobiales archaeon]